MWCSLPVVLLGLGLAVAPINAAATVMLEKVEGPPVGWVYHSEARASETIVVSVVLKEPGIEQLKHKLFRRSGDRNHPNFGSRHLSREEVRQVRKPNRRVVDTVSSWLWSSGIRDLRVDGSMINFVASVRTVKSLFQADLAHYSYGEDGKPVLRALNYTIPTLLRQDIDFIHPLTNFIAPRGGRTRGGRHRMKPASIPKAKPKSKKPCPPKPASGAAPTPTPTEDPSTLSASTSTSASTIASPSISLTPDSPIVVGPIDGGEWEPDYPCLTGTFPECIRTLYNITYNETTPSPSRFGVAGFLEQWIHHQDVADFIEHLAPELAELDPGYNYTVELFNGGINPQAEDPDSGIEAALDVEYALALGYPTEVVYYVTGGRGIKLGANGTALLEIQSDNEPFLEFLEALLAKPDQHLPHVLSISYADDEIGVPQPYAHRVCDLFAALSARGVSVFAATGDGGAAGTGMTQCTSNDGFRRKMYMPTFPASCPFVTAVGAVSNVAPPLSGAEFSSGGFSNYFPRPEFQRADVDPYVDDMIDGDDVRLPLFNWTGRAMPDISAIGSAFQIMQNGNIGSVLGTSASTPVVAAMVALVNDARLRKGKPSLGWLNPILYSDSVKEVLRDVTTGRSNGCYFPDLNRAPGWRAVKGYDCVTGLGTVGDFNDLLSVLMEV